jgi:AcrR family transcriptional regulator
MPRKAASGAGKRRDARQAMIESALTLAADRGWARVGLGDIAEAAEVSLAELRAEFSSKSAIVAAYAADIDRAVLAARDPEMAGRPATERLFDVLMRRFDLLGAHKEGVAAIIRSCPPDPEAVLCGPVALRRSMRWLLEVAMQEALGVARALDVPLPGDIEAETRITLKNVFAFGGKASLLTDLERGNRLEIEWLSGAIHRMGKETGIPTPLHSAIYKELLPLANGA